MNEEHPNISVLKRFNPKNHETASEILAEDVVFRYFNPKFPEIEGNYVGIEGFMDFFKKMATHTKGTFQTKPISIFPVGDEFVVTYVQHSMVLNGQQIAPKALVVWRIVDGKIKDAWDIPAVYT